LQDGFVAYFTGIKVAIAGYLTWYAA
jgi:hypothetical protein